MSRGINKVILVGLLGADPEIKDLQNGSTLANINLATTETWKDKETGQKKERTQWTRVVLFNRLAEIAGQYLKKGSQVYVEGKLQTRKWQADDGATRYSVEVIASQLEMLGKTTMSALGNMEVEKERKADYDEQQPVSNGNREAFAYDDDQEIPF